MLSGSVSLLFYRPQSDNIDLLIWLYPDQEHDCLPVHRVVPAAEHDNLPVHDIEDGQGVNLPSKRRACCD